MTRYFSRPSTRRGIIILALLALATVMATRGVRQNLQPPRAEVDTRLNYALFDFEARMLDEAGKLAVVMEAPVLRNNADTGVGSITRPEIYVTENGNDWNIRADTAVVSADRNFVSLAGEVRIVRYNTLDSDTLDIQTRDLVIAIETRTGSTEARVSMQHARDRLAATGMFLDLNNDYFELHHDVTAIYEPL